MKIYDTLPDSLYSYAYKVQMLCLLSQKKHTSIQSANVVPFITKETHFKLILAVSICFLFHEVLHNLIVTFLCCIMEWGHLQMNTRYTYQSEYRPASHHHYV